MCSPHHMHTLWNCVLALKMICTLHIFNNHHSICVWSCMVWSASVSHARVQRRDVITAYTNSRIQALRATHTHTQAQDTNVRTMHHVASSITTYSVASFSYQYRTKNTRSPPKMAIRRPEHMLKSFRTNTQELRTNFSMLNRKGSHASNDAQSALSTTHGT